VHTRAHLLQLQVSKSIRKVPKRRAAAAAARLLHHRRHAAQQLLREVPLRLVLDDLVLARRRGARDGLVRLVAAAAAGAAGAPLLARAAACDITRACARPSYGAGQHAGVIRWSQGA
jgi:hypothetical protein